MWKRFLTIVHRYLLLLCVGLGYMLWIRLTGIGIPCPFYQITGLKCPGCGITRMCMAMLAGHWMDALKCNIALAFFLPLLSIWFVIKTALYIITGISFRSSHEEALTWGLIALLLVFGIIRNLSNELFWTASNYPRIIFCKIPASIHKSHPYLQSTRINIFPNTTILLLFE